MTDVKSDPTPHMHTAATANGPPVYAQNVHPLTPMATGGSFATSQQPVYGSQQAGPPPGAAAYPQPGAAYPQQGAAYPQQGAAYPQQGPTAHPQANPPQGYPQQTYPGHQQTYVAGAPPSQQYIPPQPAQPSLLQQQAAVGQQFQNQLMGQCAMGAHSPRTTYGACGIIAAIVFFPIGLIFLFIDVRTECTRCGMVMR